MTRTIQPYSCALRETGKSSAKNAIEPEDNRSLFLALFDSLNKLNENLHRLNYLMERKRIEQILYRK
jgi:hypothetical protein